jgi:hypothetical protein
MTNDVRGQIGENSCNSWQKTEEAKYEINETT